ncbi:putative choline-phosphate cytidylyltransferase [Zalerion maritima]|uniref:choline-phosphate cytidylyltransferase n=1 Tax=Zalerion maritima TaxID=339359 RepID=A0AAD5RUG4_9PEZI|nr:putative choline-phosphate cytidylyltransferase [Zalerion maritima]
MSSPSSSSNAGKRKRNNTNPVMTPNPEMDQLLQPSSRDASGEDGDTTAPESYTKPHPSKRQRANPERTANSASASMHGPAGREGVDPGEPSDTTEASLDIENRVGRKSRRSNNTSNSTVDAMDLEADPENENEKETEAMPPPPTGKMIHPAGYRTNPPPVGRPYFEANMIGHHPHRHMRQLEQAKKAFPNTHLLVGVTGDEETHRRKGLTVLSGAERAETVRHCKWVDEVVENCPWIVTPEFLDQHQLDYVAHDDLPYGADEGDDIYKPIKEAGKFLVTQRTEGVSTTGIITKIVRDYEKYIARQIRRGMSRQELNVSWLKKNEMDIKRQVNELRDNIRTNWSTTGQELGREIKQFWPASRPQSPARVPAIQTVQNGEQSLNVPRSPTQPTTPGADRDLITGYTLGLIGSVRGWMENRRRNINRDSRAPSEDDEDESDSRSDARKSTEGRRSTDVRRSNESSRKVPVVAPSPSLNP